jgi:FkbM family methyltransferase
MFKVAESMIQRLAQRFRRTSLPGRALRTILPVSIIQIDGCKYEVHPKDNHTEYEMFIRRSMPEPETYNYLMKRCKYKRTQFIDIGANCGSFSIPIACVSGSQSAVLAFEPNPIMVNRLNKNISLNNLRNVEVHPVALGLREESMTLHLPRGRLGNYGQGSLVMHRDKSRGALVMEVPAKVLTPELLTSPDHYEYRALKIDVEGYEDRCLYPFIKFAPDNSLPETIIVETDHRNIWEFDLLGILNARGYRKSKTADGNQIFEMEHQNG